MWNIRSHARRFPVHTGTLTPSIAHPNRFLNHLKRFSAGFLTFRGGKIKKCMVLGAESTIWNARREAGQPSQSSPIGLASSPKGRGSGETASVAVCPETLQFIRQLSRHVKGPIPEGAGIEQSEMTGGVSHGEGCRSFRYGWLCDLPANFPAMPRAPSQRGLSAQQTGGVFSPKCLYFRFSAPES